MIASLRVDSFLGPSARLIAGRSLGFAASFAIPVVLARLYAPEEFGTYKQLFLIFATLHGVAQLGMAESLYYFLPRHPDGAGRLVANAVLTLALAGVLAAAVLVWAREPIGLWLTNPSLSTHLDLLAIFLALMLTSAGLEIVGIARGQFSRAAWTYAVSDTSRTALMVVPALVFRDVRGLMLGAVGFAAARVLYMAWRLWREFGATVRMDRGLWRRQLAYALPFAAAVGVEVVQIGYPQYAVAARVDAATFAIFAVGCLQIPLVEVIATSMANVLMVRMSEAERAGRMDEAVRLWHGTICRIALVIFPVVVLLVIAARDLILTLFTATYAASVPIFMLWTLTIVPSVLCVDAVLRVHARTRALLWLNVVRLAVVAALVGWSLGTFGLSGAVLTVLLATLLARALGVAAIARRLSLPLSRAVPWIRLAGIAACALGAAMPALWIRQALPLAPWAGLCVTVTCYLVACAAVYSLVTTAGRLVPAEPLSHRPARASLLEG